MGGCEARVHIFPLVGRTDETGSCSEWRPQPSLSTQPCSAEATVTTRATNTFGSRFWPSTRAATHVLFRCSNRPRANSPDILFLYWFSVDFIAGHAKEARTLRALPSVQKPASSSSLRKNCVGMLMQRKYSDMLSR